MLVYNCTKAAVDFFTVTRKGKKDSPLTEPPIDSISDSGNDVRHISQWLVHAIKVQRKHVLIVMHIHTRYAMIFCNLKKGDWNTFLELHLERLFNNMQFFGEEFEMCDEHTFHNMFRRYLRKHPKPYFCKRGDRSAQSHINEVVWQFEDRVNEIGVLPNNQEEAASFDEWINSMIRSTKRHPDYFYPDEEMFFDWMLEYGDLDPSEREFVQANFASLRQQMRATGISDPDKIDEIQAAMEAVMEQHNKRINKTQLDSLPDNVVDFQAAKASQKH
ncbi:DUF6933 domain-containing protein [Vibrio sp. HN007]|uniref:DUF6933 domain-containing protein n=1 Tax=Vibrio iocasae TaxID=3098914 RepID=UPI0035D3F8E8